MTYPAATSSRPGRKKSDSCAGAMCGFFNTPKIAAKQQADTAELTRIADELCANKAPFVNDINHLHQLVQQHDNGDYDDDYDPVGHSNFSFDDDDGDNIVAMSVDDPKPSSFQLESAAAPMMIHALDRLGGTHPGGGGLDGQGRPTSSSRYCQ